MVREGIAEEVPFKAHLPEVQETVWEELAGNILSRSSIGRGPGQEGPWPCLRSRQVACMAGAGMSQSQTEREVSRGKELGFYSRCTENS